MLLNKSEISSPRARGRRPRGQQNIEADVLDLDQLYRAALARREVNIANESRGDSAPSYASLLLAGVAVITVHGAALLAVLHERRQPLVHETKEEASYQATVSIIDAARVHDVVILPEMRLVSPSIEAAITKISFEDPDADIVPGIIGPASAPQLDPAVAVDPQPYARRAGLNPGEAVTVILAIEVLVDGSAGQVIVVTGAGNSTIDDAAMAYARSLRWIPATTNRRATVRRIALPVTLRLS